MVLFLVLFIFLLFSTLLVIRVLLVVVVLKVIFCSSSFLLLPACTCVVVCVGAVGNLVDLSACKHTVPPSFVFLPCPLSFILHTFLHHIFSLFVPPLLPVLLFLYCYVFFTFS